MGSALKGLIDTMVELIEQYIRNSLRNVSSSEPIIKCKRYKT